MKKYIVAYIPVLHSGYISFLNRHKDADALFLFGEEIIGIFDWLARKDVRAVSPRIMKDALVALGVVPVEILDLVTISSLIKAQPLIIMPDEDEARAVARQYFPDLAVTFENVFLRWDKSRSLKTIDPVAVEVTSRERDVHFIGQAFSEAGRSSDWWRQIGALIVKDGEVVLVGHNRHVPTERTPYEIGDPRGFFRKGVNIDLSTALHAEAGLIAEAARRGISLEGSSLYVTTFPCPTCAKLIAYSGVKRCYFSEGYAVLDGESILADNDVALLQVVPP